jgi:hypothetical protein
MVKRGSYSSNGPIQVRQRRDTRQVLCYYNDRSQSNEVSMPLEIQKGKANNLVNVHALIAGNWESCAPSG